MNKSLVLVGMNVRPLAQSAVAAGFDVVALDAFLEVNPRYSASMELAEEALAVPLFLWHTCRVPQTITSGVSKAP